MFLEVSRRKMEVTSLCILVGRKFSEMVSLLDTRKELNISEDIRRVCKWGANSTERSKRHYSEDYMKEQSMTAQFYLKTYGIISTLTELLICLYISLQNSKARGYISCS